VLMIDRAGFGEGTMVQQPVMEAHADSTCGSLLRELQV
jgi:hypothetical protein